MAVYFLRARHISRGKEVAEPGSGGILGGGAWTMALEGCQPILGGLLGAGTGTVPLEVFQPVLGGLLRGRFRRLGPTAVTQRCKTLAMRPQSSM
jgi:hypothetical protein